MKAHLHLRRWMAGLVLAGALVPAAVARAQSGGGAGSGSGEAMIIRRCPSCEAEESRLRAEVAQIQQRIVESAMKVQFVRGSEIDTLAVRRAQDELRVALRDLQTAQARLAAVRSRAIVVQTPSPEATTRLMQGKVLPGTCVTPPGYLGVYLTTYRCMVEVRDGKRLWRYLDYPVVESVEPGTPADRAGMLAGDVILAYDGKDLKSGRLPLDEILVPGNRIPVRVRREGEPKTLDVTVGARPRMRVAIGDSFLIRAPRAPVARTPLTPLTPMTPATPPTPPVSPMPFTGLASVVAGAELVAMHGDLGSYFGVESGLLVLRVGEGTPIARAGLQAADVIVRADGEDVESVQELRQIIADADGRHGVRLDIIRKGKKQSLRVTW